MRPSPRSSRSRFAPQPYITLFQEVRVGAFAHNPNHDEDAPVDVSVETLSSNLPFANFSNPYVNWFLSPAIALGGMINTGGKTSYAFADFNWRIPIWKMLFFEGEFGGAVNNSPDWQGPQPHRHGLPADVPRVGRLRPSAHPELGRHRERRACLARKLLHQQEPGRYRFRRDGRLQVLTDMARKAHVSVRLQGGERVARSARLGGERPPPPRGVKIGQTLSVWLRGLGPRLAAGRRPSAGITADLS